MTRLILLRHGQTDWNIVNRFQGHSDIELSPTGHAQAAAVAELIAALHPDVIYSSDLRRCTATAAPLAARTGLPVTLDRRLRERGYGEWEGLTHTEVRQGWPDELARWLVGQPVLGGGVEEIVDLAKRVGEALREIAEGHPGGTVVAVTHGGASRQAVAAQLGWGDELSHTLGGLENCHYSELRLRPSGTWVLAAHNVGVAHGGAVLHGGAARDGGASPDGGAEPAAAR